MGVCVCVYVCVYVCAHVVVIKGHYFFFSKIQSQASKEVEKKRRVRKRMWHCGWGMRYFIACRRCKETSMRVSHGLITSRKESKKVVCKNCKLLCVCVCVDVIMSHTRTRTHVLFMHPPSYFLWHIRLDLFCIYQCGCVIIMFVFGFVCVCVWRLYNTNNFIVLSPHNQEPKQND